MTSSIEYKIIRSFVLERDCHKCIRCGSVKGLNVHHKDRSGFLGYAMANNEPENLETLCDKCHRLEHGGDKRNYTGMTDKQIYGYANW